MFCSQFDTNVIPQTIILSTYLCIFFPKENMGLKWEKSKENKPSKGFCKIRLNKDNLSEKIHFQSQ